MTDSKRPDNLSVMKILEDVCKHDFVEDKKAVAEPPQSKGKFRFANQYVLLTYKTHLPKLEVREYFDKHFSVKTLEIAHEKGDNQETPYEHTHIVINFGRQFHSQNARIFDLNGIHPHVQPFKRFDYGKVVGYLAKEDPENEHLKKNNIGMLASKIWGCETVQDALMTARTPSDVNGIIALYNNKPVEVIDDKLEFRPWQKQVWDMLEKKPDDRSIIWIRDLKGGAGKSRFTRWMLVNKLAVVFKQFGGTRDSASIIADEISRGWDQRIIICDLSREFEERQIYAALECLKDGMVTTTKYVGKSVAFKCPHIVVFANFWPDVIKMSLDRWRLYNVLPEGKDGAYNIKSAPVNEVFELQHPKKTSD